MNTPITSQNQVEPLVAPHGEIVYELFGRASEHGGVEGHSLACVVIPPGKASLAHHHRTSEESYYILRGAARMLIDDQEYSLGPGLACLIKPGQVHQIFNAGDQDLEFLAICAPAWYPEDSYFEQAPSPQ